MAQVIGQYGQGMSQRLFSLLDLYKGIDRKRMAKTVGGGRIEDQITDELSGLLETDIFDRPAEEGANLVFVQGFVPGANQKIRVLIVIPKAISEGKIVLDFCDYGLGDGDQSVFSELGLLDIQCGIIPAIMLSHYSQGLGDSQSASSQ